MKKYLCIKCKKISNSNEWNKSTKDYFKCDIVPVEEENKNCCNFVCPKCNKELEGSDVIEEVYVREFLYESLSEILNDIGKIETEVGSFNSEYKLKVIDKIQSLLKEIK